jgi:sedoheptulose-bisphosphatase
VEELKKTGVVRFVLSEETPHPVEIHTEGALIVTFDPLDGSSIVGSNWSVGAIVGIWECDESVLIGKRGRDQVGASCCVFGSRTSALFHNTATDGVDEHTLIGNIWRVTKTSIQIRSKGKIFSPGNLRAV